MVVLQCLWEHENGGIEQRFYTKGDAFVVMVDAHQHFWSPARVRYPWLAPYYPELVRDYSFADLKPHLSACGVDATVLVQSADSLADDELMFEIAAAHAEIAGIVAWLPLEDAERTHVLIDEFMGSQRVVGVRTLIHNHPDPDWVLRPAVAEGLDVVAARGLPFDLVAVLPRHLEHVPSLCERHPSLRIVIDHLAKPPIGEDLSRWSEMMARAAASPNVYAKVSGLYPAAGDRMPWTADDLRPAFECALELFGSSRLMLGSDWPICEVAGGYESVVRALLSLFDELDDTARADLCGGTALECYGLEVAK